MNYCPTTALVRRPPKAYASYYAEEGIEISPVLADLQFDNYVTALRSAGLDVKIIDPDDKHHDSVFIEDTAVIWQLRALSCRLPPPREGENAAIESFLSNSFAIIHMPSDAFLEGGDVLHIGEITYVGFSKQTNKEGVKALKKFLYPLRRVIEVPVEKSLHLKTVITYLGNGTVVAVRDAVNLDLFEFKEVIFTEPGEDQAANCLRVKDHLIIPAGNPFTERSLRQFCKRANIQIIPLDISEFEKGEGSLTCLSIIF